MVDQFLSCLYGLALLVSVVAGIWALARRW